METSFYPVVTVDNDEELAVIQAFCDEHRIEYDCLDGERTVFPLRILVYADREDIVLNFSAEDEI